MNEGTLRELLLAFQRGEVTLDDVLARLRHLPYEDLGFAKLDHHRLLRQGFPEVVFGQGKTPEQIAAIVVRLLERGSLVLVTRADEVAYAAVHRVVPEAVYHPHARMITIRRGPPPEPEGLIAVVSAGTADIPVAEEAAVTAEALGNRVARFYDVGVAGLHRLLSIWEPLAEARVVVCVAGMEGALPSVVGGLVGVPVIAVPTSIGYGIGHGGLAALLGMLNSCAANVVVVNIDNGFGAGIVASLINHLPTKTR
ncbi:hypothetical protein HRbin08_01814 [bacterium HR08]|nr:hypothetical protein HRbin08_01814 [bacterium HR08]